MARPHGSTASFLARRLRRKVNPANSGNTLHTRMQFTVVWSKRHLPIQKVFGFLRLPRAQGGVTVLLCHAQLSDGQSAGCTCTDSCTLANDGICQDGDVGTLMTNCDGGTDCTDCGCVRKPRASGLCLIAQGDKKAARSARRKLRTSRQLQPLTAACTFASAKHPSPNIFLHAPGHELHRLRRKLPVLPSSRPIYLLCMASPDAHDPRRRAGSSLVVQGFELPELVVCAERAARLCSEQSYVVSLQSP